jgi:regulator of sigma E protease
MELPVCDIVTIWTQWAWPILLFILGLGAVVFVHELGHFMVAKAVGIRVDKFALGFGPRLFGIKRGETDYCINILPLGGYVRMPGQEDFKPLEEVNDPRAFNNKPVWARMAVTAAGVIMNVIFACLLFVIVGMAGMEFNSPVVGAVEPGYPASQAKIQWLDGAPGPNDSIGLRPGDEVLEISGHSWPWGTFHRPVEHFKQVNIITLVADLDETFTLKIKRHVDDHDYVGLATLGVSPIALVPGVSAPMFGIHPADSLVFAKPENKVDMPFQPRDRIVEVDGHKIDSRWQLEDLEKTWDGHAVKVVVVRDGKPLAPKDVQPMLHMHDVIFLTDGTRVGGAIMPFGEKQDTLTAVTLDGKQTQLPRDKVLLKYGEPLDILGMLPRLKANFIEKGSRADTAGLLPGDIVTDYANNGPPTFHSFQEITADNVGKPLKLSVLRGETPQTLEVTPARHNDEAKVGVIFGPDQDHLEIAGIRDNSPIFQALEKAEPGQLDDTKRAAVFAKFKGYKLEKVNDEPVHNWIDVLSALKAAQQAKDDSVQLTFTQGASPQELKLKVALTPTAPLVTQEAKMFSPQDYRFSVVPDLPGVLEPLKVKIIKHNPGAAISWGVGETRAFMINGYASIRALIKGSIPLTATSGPVGIAAASVQIAREGFLSFVYFMAIISTILAVMNFLPIPVVDGGLAVFLIIEKIMGKPLPLKTQNIVQIGGLILMIGVFLYVTWQDVARLIKGMW